MQMKITITVGDYVLENFLINVDVSSDPEGVAHEQDADKIKRLIAEHFKVIENNR